jgi:BarA-like signal transduction histidine kinase
MPCVFLALPGKEDNGPVQHIPTTPSGVFLMLCVFLALPVKENSTPMQHILTTPSGVILMSCVFLALPCKERQQACAILSSNTLWCV